MPSVTGIGNQPTVQVPSGGEHGDHGVNSTASNASVGQPFSTVLAQAIGQAPESAAHGSHGGTGNGLSANGTSPSGASNATANTPNGGSHSAHFPIGKSDHVGEHGFQESVLGLRAYRQQLIASNIANADTPGYKAVDIDFQEALRIARSASNTSPLMLSTTVSGHISAQVSSSAPPYPLKYSSPSQQNVDGNTVDMDVERAKFAENAIMYEYSLDRVKGHFMMMQDLLKNLPF